jgi:hypothetical protein
MSDNSDERRRRPRISTMILCEIRIGNQPPELVRVRDLNECGVKIATNRPLMLRDRLRVRLPGTEDWCLARVAWCTKGTAGLAFARAVDLPSVVGVRAAQDPFQRERLAS